MRQSDRFIVNVLSNYGLTLVGGVASLVLVPIVILDLSRSGYGLAAMLLATFTVAERLGASINRAMERYIPRDLASDDAQRVSVTFNSALACHAVLGIVAAAAIWGLKEWYLDDPHLTDSLISDGATAFALVALTMLLGAPLLAYRAGLEAIQRYDLVVTHVSAAMLLRTVVVIVIFKLGHGSITVFVVSQLAAVIGSCFLCRRALRKVLPQLRESPRFIQSSCVKTLATFALATLLISTGNVLGLEGFRVLVGKGLSMADAGGLSAIWAFRSMVFMTIRSMTRVLTPTVSALDARGSSENVSKLLFAATKYSTIAATSICIVPLMVADSFIFLWLGKEFENLIPLMYTVMLAQIPLAMSTSSQQVLIGLGRMRVTGPAILLRGGGSLLAAGLYMFFSSEPNLIGAALWLYAVQVLGSLFVTIYGSAVAGVGQVRTMFDGLLRPVFLGGVSATLLWLVSKQFGVDSWWRLFAAIGVGEIVFLALVLTVGLGVEERGHMLGFVGRVKKKLQRAKPSDSESNR